MVGIGTLQMDYPHEFIQQYLGYKNSATWRGNGPEKWLCTNAEAVLHDDTTSPKTYKFMFEFTHNGQKWEDWVWFIDENTGKRPPGLIAGVGYKEVVWLPRTDFNVDFPS